MRWFLSILLFILVCPLLFLGEVWWSARWGCAAAPFPLPAERRLVFDQLRSYGNAFFARDEVRLTAYELPNLTAEQFNALAATAQLTPCATFSLDTDAPALMGKVIGALQKLTAHLQAAHPEEARTCAVWTWYTFGESCDFLYNAPLHALLVVHYHGITPPRPEGL